VTTLQINLLYTLIVAMIVYFTGQMLVARVGWLQRFTIPAPVVGGCLIAIILALTDGLGGVRVSFDMSLKDNFLLMFFTTVGLAADARMLVKGGPKLLIFLAISSVFIIVQNAVGLGAALAMDLHPLVGLIGGSITLTGGHGTGGAYAIRFGETMNLYGAMELAMACATAGLVLGSLLGGPLAQYLIRRHELSGPTRGAKGDATAAAAEPQKDDVNVQSFLGTLFLILISLAAGKMLAQWVQGTGFILPDFLFCLLLGVTIRNASTLLPAIRVSDTNVDLIGGIALSLFLVMALMAMRLIDLLSLAGPLLLILALQVAAMIVFAVFVTFRVMGKSYDAAILTAGQVGFALSSTAAALAIMKAVTERSGPSPLAFLIVPMVGAFFIDVVNAIVIQGFLTLPLFGF
jgi:ESS family glutamate:Na+ symporter